MEKIKASKSVERKPKTRNSRMRRNHSVEDFETAKPKGLASLTMEDEFGFSGWLNKHATTKKT
tara:strand:- start:226 stop:414 length:189 start_codon:yes stop_codon:yes gene_type:complete